MKQETPFFQQYSLRISIALILIVLGIYLIFRNIPLHPQINAYFFPIILVFAGLYWLSDYFLTEREGALVPGMLFSVLGIFLILSRWQLIPPLSISWPLLLACIGGVLWVNALIERISAWPMLLLMAVGILLYATSLPWFSFSKLLSYWPVLIIIAGLSLMFRPRQHPKTVTEMIPEASNQEALDDVEISD